MTVAEAILLGGLQGVTEFLPISSSGHLVLVEQLLGLHIAPKNLQVFNVLLHTGTVLALLLAYAPVWRTLLSAPFRRDSENVRRLLLLVIATIPGAVAGLLFDDWIAMHFQSLLYVGGAFACTAIVLVLGECCQEKKRKPQSLTTRSAFFIGIAQALALIPGISRSGFTISAGRVMGLNRKDALDFSFLMALPIIAGASVVSIVDIIRGTVFLPPVHIIALAVAVSFVSSLLSIVFLRRFVVRRSLAWFAPYLLIASALTVLKYFA